MNGNIKYLGLRSSSDFRSHRKIDFLYVNFISFSSALADAVICPAALTDATQFLFISEALYKLQLQRFNAPPEAVEAKLQVKRCTDKISLGNRVLLTKAWVISFF